MHRGSQGSSKVGRAGSNITEFLIESKFHNLFDMLASSAKSIEDSLNISTRLHRNDSELIFLVDPDKESLILVVEDASAVGPVSVESNSLKVSVTLLEEEVVLDKLLSLILSQIVQRIVSALKIAFHMSQSFADLLLNFFSLVIGNAWS